MKKVFIFFFSMIIGNTIMYAGTWVVGVNQVDRFLNAIEQGVGEEPPTILLKGDGSINTDYDDNGVGWLYFPGITCTSEEISGTTYLSHDDSANHWHAIYEINYANKGYKQIAETEIKFEQPSTVDFDYSGIPEGYPSVENYMDRNDLGWLEVIDLSGNDLNNIVIDGGPYNAMPLRIVNLSYNPNMTSISIVNCTNLEEVDLSGTALTAEAFETLKGEILESSPGATIIFSLLNVAVGGVITPDAPQVSIQGNNVFVKNMKTSDVVTILNLSGQKLLETTEATINVGAMAQGIYLVKINSYITKIRL